MRQLRMGGGSSRKRIRCPLACLACLAKAGPKSILFGTPCDLLIAVGVSFDGLATRSFSPRWSGLKADVVHVDPDPSAIGQFVATSLGITTSSRAFVESLHAGQPPQPSRRVTLPPSASSKIPETRGEIIHPLTVMREMELVAFAECNDLRGCGDVHFLGFSRDTGAAGRQFFCHH